MLELHDVAYKSELGRIEMTQQTGTSGGSPGGLADGNSRLQGPGGSALSSDIQVHQGSQSAGGIGSHDFGNSHRHESAGAESSMHNGNDQSFQQGSANLNEGALNTLRHAGALGFVPSAASAYDAANDIMEALRGKHANLASELEVIIQNFQVAFVYFI